VKAELERLEADLALSAAVPNVQIAEACLRRAMTTARQQGAKWWELRATTSLARLWGEQGRRAEARDLLEPRQKRRGRVVSSLNPQGMGNGG
jgi:predicted ATPase